MTYSLVDFMLLLGALGLFLYGMKVMSDALLQLAGSRMRSILATATSSRLLAVFTGFAFTAIVQSSSATTLMVVSFANASLLPLTEAIAVIMGANIGTTVTAWLITLLGFKIKLSVFALPLIAVGFLMSLSKKPSLHNWGLFIVGFALLFLGLEYLKDAVPDLHAHPEKLALVREFSHQGFGSILMFLLVGTILTLVVQSSSAGMALIIIMAYEGWINFELAAAMVLGQNIGTTITANLAALVGNYQAKRTALAHLIFNLVGVTWILLVLQPALNFAASIVEVFEGISPDSDKLAVPFGLSVFHTLFNVANTIILVGFISPLARLVEKIIPDVPERRTDLSRPHYLSDNAMLFPETAIKALLDESRRLFQKTTYKVVTHGLHIHRDVFEHEPKLKKILKSVEKIELDVDDIYLRKIKSIYGEIVTFATELQSRYELSEEDIRSVRSILRADRLMVELVKSTKPLHENMYRYLNSDNKAIVKEYNLLRKLILKTLIITRRLVDADATPKNVSKKLSKMSRAINNYDTLQNGTVEKLIRNHTINPNMATSLINDSAVSMAIARRLIEVATLLYFIQSPEQAE